MPKTNTSNSFADDILVKDENGDFKVLSKGKWQVLEAYRPQASKAKPTSVSAPPKDNLRETVRGILEKVNLSLDSELESRFQNIVQAHLRGVRSSLDTFLVLKREKEEGGLGLNEEQAEQVLEAVNRRQGSLAARVRPKQEKPAKEAPLDLEHELAPPPPVIQQAKATSKAPSKPTKPLKEVKFKPSLGRLGMEQPSSPTLKEVRFKPQLVGPVEEIKNLSLLDFRRLDKNPREAAQKINYKIDLLEKDSYQKRQEGLKAWRESELNKLYLELGRLAIEQGKPIGEIIKAKQVKNEASLTMEEFEALLNLNGELKY